MSLEGIGLAAGQFAVELAGRRVRDWLLRRKLQRAYWEAASGAIDRCATQGFPPTSETWIEVASLLGTERLAQYVARLFRMGAGEDFPDVDLFGLTASAATYVRLFIIDLNERRLQLLPSDQRISTEVMLSQISLLLSRFASQAPHFTSTPPAPPRAQAPPSSAQLITEFRRASGPLRRYPNSIAGIHLHRPEVDEILEWALASPEDDAVALLVDEPGMGKSALLREVLEALEARGLPVLGIKADLLSASESQRDLGATLLTVPTSLQESVSILALDGPVVVIIDQLDALSLALTRNPVTIELVMGLVAGLREMPAVRIILSCRMFDWKTDLRLSSVEVDRTFQLRPLDENAICEVLAASQIEAANLLPDYCSLLSTPLNLDIFRRIYSGSTLVPQERYRTLQDLYDGLWRRRVSVPVPAYPSIADRVRAIHTLVDSMQSRQDVSAPAAVLDAQADAAAYLQSVGFIQREGDRLFFSHQTLLDYCYARQFVADGRNLAAEVISGPQGFFERSQILQVLAFLKGTDPTQYQNHLSSLLFAEQIRVHLRIMLVQWLGALTAPTDAEVAIARRLLWDSTGCQQFFDSAQSNATWLPLLKEDIEMLLTQVDERTNNVVTYYLRSVVNSCATDVISLLSPRLGRSDMSDVRICFCLAEIRDWRVPGAASLLIDILRRGTGDHWPLFCLESLARTDPSKAAEAIAAYLDKRLDDLLAASDDDGASPDIPEAVGPVTARWHWGRKLLGEHSVQTVMEMLWPEHWEALLDRLVPWFLRAAEAATQIRGDADWYSIDSLFADGWYGQHISEGAVFAMRLGDALGKLARSSPESFRTLASRLARTEMVAAHRVLIQGYLAAPAEYATDVYAYFKEDRRRLRVSEPSGPGWWDSSRLLAAVFPYVTPAQRADFERLVTKYRSQSRPADSDNLALMRFRFLARVDDVLLTKPARLELERLRQRYSESELAAPLGIHGGFVTSPISEEQQQTLSDGAWLDAMHDYNDSVQWDPREFLKGGVTEFAHAVQARTKEDPARFYGISQQFDEEISTKYIVAVIVGLAESKAPAAWLFETVRRFRPRLIGDAHHMVPYALRKRERDQVPDDLLDLLADWALHDPSPEHEGTASPTLTAPYYLARPFLLHFDGVRAAAIVDCCACAMFRDPPQVARALDVISGAIHDRLFLVRLSALYALATLLNPFDERVMTVFEEALQADERLRATTPAQWFTAWLAPRHFARFRPHLEAMLHSDVDGTRQGAAFLVCSLSLKLQESGKLAEGAIRGDEAMRRGAAAAFARNLHLPEAQEACREALRRLIADSDVEVRRAIAECFQDVRPEQLFQLRSFIEAYLRSPSLPEGAQALVEYLTPLALEDIELSLAMVDAILQQVGGGITNALSIQAGIDGDLVNICLAVYNHADAATVKTRAMNLFDQLLSLGSSSAREALSAWDRG